MLMQRFKKFKFIIPLMAGLAIVAMSSTLTECSGAGTPAHQTSEFTAKDLYNAQLSVDSGLRFDNTGIIPLATPSDQKTATNANDFKFRLHNDNDSSYTITSVTIQDPDNGHTPAIRLNNYCSGILAAKSNCEISISPTVNSGNHTNFIIVRLKNNKNNQNDELNKTNAEEIVLRQMIQLSDTLSTTDGTSAKINDVIAANNGKYSLAVPYLLTKDFDQLELKNGTLDCPQGSNKGNMCTAYIDGQMSTANQEQIQLIFKHSDPKLNDQQLTQSTISYQVSKITSSYLLMSYATDVSGNQEGTLVIFNRGTKAESVTIGFAETDPTLEISKYALDGNQTADLNQCLTIQSQATCTISIKLKKDAKLNGSSIINVKENNELKNSALVHYSVNQLSLNMVTDVNPDSISPIVGEESEATFTFTNRGDRDFKIDGISWDNSAVGWSKSSAPQKTQECAKNQSLTPSSACTLKFTYKPNNISEQKQFIVVVSGSSVDQHGITQYYRLSSAARYLALAPLKMEISWYRDENGNGSSNVPTKPESIIISPVYTTGASRSNIDITITNLSQQSIPFDSNKNLALNSQLLDSSYLWGSSAAIWICHNIKKNTTASNLKTLDSGQSCIVKIQVDYSPTQAITSTEKATAKLNYSTVINGNNLNFESTLEFRYIKMYGDYNNVRLALQDNAIATQDQSTKLISIPYAFTNNTGTAIKVTKAFPVTIAIGSAVGDNSSEAKTYTGKGVTASFDETGCINLKDKQTCTVTLTYEPNTATAIPQADVGVQLDYSNISGNITKSITNLELTTLAKIPVVDTQYKTTLDKSDKPIIDTNQSIVGIELTEADTWYTLGGGDNAGPSHADLTGQTNGYGGFLVVPNGLIRLNNTFRFFNFDKFNQGNNDNDLVWEVGRGNISKFIIKVLDRNNHLQDLSISATRTTRNCNKLWYLYASAACASIPKVVLEIKIDLSNDLSGTYTGSFGIISHPEITNYKRFGNTNNSGKAHYIPITINYTKP